VDVFRTKILEINSDSIINNIKLIFQTNNTIAASYLPLIDRIEN
jgi:hypothetical protein